MLKKKTPYVVKFDRNYWKFFYFMTEQLKAENYMLNFGYA